MIRLLDDLALLREIDEIKGLDYTADNLRRKHSDKIVVIRRVAYIKKEVLCDTALAHVSDLSNYIQLGELAEQLKVRREGMIKKIYFMEESKKVGNGITIFDYKKIGGVYFIRLQEDIKELFKSYTPFLAEYNDAHLMVEGRMLGDMKIGFY